MPTQLREADEQQDVRGRVVHPDGWPAPGIPIRARGSSQESDHAQVIARTAADGSYEMILPSGETDGIRVEADDWTAISRLNVELPACRPADGVDFTLVKGTLLRGRVTLGADDRPVVGQVVYVQETASDRVPFAELAKAVCPGRKVIRQLNPTTNGDGRYSDLVGPGRYIVWEPARTETVEVSVVEEPETESERGRNERPTEGVPGQAKTPLGPGFSRWMGPLEGRRDVWRPGDPGARAGWTRWQDRGAGDAW